MPFRNADSGVPHNVSIYTDVSASRAVFRGELFPGPRTKTYKVRALAAGSYFYRCDVHPTTMTGTIEAR
jgi:plastocyanin